jgi:RES domain-containing protein
MADASIPRGVPALYLSLDPITVLKEMGHGFSRRLEPLVLCSYDVDCEDIVDLRTDGGREEAGGDLETMASAWMSDIAAGSRPISWSIHDRLVAQRKAGILTPSFARGAVASDINLVLWRWGPKSPHRVEVFDPSGRLPKNQLSWT